MVSFYDLLLKDIGLLFDLKKDKNTSGIYVEGGPNNKSGEITPAAALQLGIDPDPVNGGVAANRFLLVVFPGSSKELGIVIDKRLSQILVKF